MRRKAAAVPASKAVIGVTYAVMRDGELTRFTVSRITTHRIANNGSPHDYESEITGQFVTLDPNDPKNSIVEKATIRPDQLLGRYEEHLELVAEREKQEAARKQEQRAANEAALDLCRLFYQVAGLVVPNDFDGYYQPFRVGKYGSNDKVDMEKSGVAPLLAGLRKLLAKEPVS